ncbi:hypothetical protein ACWGS9_35560, partial [Bradyrhizobium sp. Arg314]
MPGIVAPRIVQLSMNAGSFISIWINTDHHHEATGVRYEPSAAANPEFERNLFSPDEIRLY